MVKLNNGDEITQEEFDNKYGNHKPFNLMTVKELYDFYLSEALTGVNFPVWNKEMMRRGLV